MSLNARDRQTLSRIEEGLAGSDPRFAARLSAFSRLADGDGMPARERIRPRGQWIGPLCEPRWWLRWTGGAWILWLVITVAMLTVAIVLSRSGPASQCGRLQGFACTQQPAPTSPPASGAHGGSAGYGGGAPSGGLGAG